MMKDLDYAVFLRLFKGREDHIAQQGEDYYLPVARPLDEFYLAMHFNGDATFGLYLLTHDSYCHLLCIDVDIPKGELDHIDFRDPKVKYDYLATQLNGLVDTLHNQLGFPDSSVVLEETGGRGYHVWIFLSDPLPGVAAVAFGRELKTHLGFDIEFFPKQGTISPSRKLGNLVKLPLGLHQKYGSWSKFFTLGPDGPVFCDDLTLGLDLLSGVTPVSISIIESIIQSSSGTSAEGIGMPARMRKQVPRLRFRGTPDLLISRCAAMRRLREKAGVGKRLSHTEAFHFANTMLSVSDGIAYIHETMRLSLGSDYDSGRTDRETGRIEPLGPVSCRTLIRQGVCPGYCKPSVGKRNEDPLASNTTPCSVWLERKKSEVSASQQDLRDQISDVETAERAFFRLKQYHEHEDSLFFDPFDFALFERDLNQNCRVVAQMFSKNVEPSLTGHIPVLVPKKLNDDLDLQYRRMAYTSVYDLVPIQTVFDVIAPTLEASSHSCSHGYRWNMDTSAPLRIFADWRETYPRFRAGIISALQENSSGYYVCCDIKAYYDNVNHEILIQQLRNAISDEVISGFVQRAIQSYESEEGKKKGLPQGPAYARLLANLYLNDFDSFAAGLGAGYFRYVDDFVMVFDTYEEARNGLERVAERLLELGLELSQDEGKKATLVSNVDFSRIYVTLDKIQYGILESRRHLAYLAPNTISDFYDAVDRHSATPASLEQILKINEALPTLLYVVSEEPLTPHPFILKLFAICEFLIKHGWFCPKRLKTIFYRLIEIAPNEDGLVDLFDHLESSHKVYFLLSVFGSWHAHGQRTSLLARLLKKAVADGDSMVRGIAFPMLTEARLWSDVGCLKESVLTEIAKPPDWFELARFLGIVDYLELSPEARASLRKLVTRSSPVLTKVLLLSNLEELPRDYVDSVYVKGLLEDFHAELLPAVASIAAKARNRSDLFNSIIAFLADDPRFKSLSVLLATRAVAETLSSAGAAELENHKSVYEAISDPEIKEALLRVLGRVQDYGGAYDEEFAKGHRQLLNYNGCFLFEHMGDVSAYSYLELIPEERLREYTGCDIAEARRVIEDLSLQGILPPVDFHYDSTRREVRLQYRADGLYTDLAGREYDLETESVLQILKLASDIFKKASYFRKRFGKVPLVSVDNLLIGHGGDTLVFRTIGQTLRVPYFMSGVTIGDDESDISAMVAILIRNLLFSTDQDTEQFLGQNYHTPPHALVAQFILNMSAKEPSHRYSWSRFQFLVERFEPASRCSQSDLGILYLRERLRSALFRCNANGITWHGLCRALNAHVSHVRTICGPDSLHKVRLRNELLSFRGGRRKLHTLCRELLNITLNRRRILELPLTACPYADMLEYLLLQAVLCVETFSLCRSAVDESQPDLSLLDDFGACGEISICAAGYEVRVKKTELAGAFLYKADGTGTDIRDLSLKQIALVMLLTCGIEQSASCLSITRPRSFSASHFDDFVHLCLYRIPRMEESFRDCIQESSSDLRSNDEPTIDVDLAGSHEDIDVVADVLNHARRGLGLSRYHGQADGRKFPPNVSCRTGWLRTFTAKERAFPGIALTHAFPSSRYECSWDTWRDKVTNLVVPNDGVYSFIMDLKKGHLLGLRASYIYYGRAMLPWDLLALIASHMILLLLGWGAGSSEGGLLETTVSAGKTVFQFAFRILFFKIVLWDLPYWIPPVGRLVRSIRRAWKHRDNDFA